MTFNVTRRALGLSLGGMIAGLATNQASAQQKIVIKLGWAGTDGPQDPYAVGARFFRDLCSATDGRVVVELYPNRQLGDEKPLTEGMRLGTVDAGIITNAVLAQIEPSLQLNDMPFLFADEVKARSMLDGPVGQKLGANLEKKGVKLLAWMEGGFAT